MNYWYRGPYEPLRPISGQDRTILPLSHPTLCLRRARGRRSAAPTERQCRPPEDRPSVGGRGARPARRDEGAYLAYVTEEQRSRTGWIVCQMLVEILRDGTRAPNGLKTERICGVASSPRRDEGAPCAVEAGWVVGPSGEYSTYLTDEQRRDAPQIRDFATDSTRSVLWARGYGNWPAATNKSTRAWRTVSSAMTTALSASRARRSASMTSMLVVAPAW
jgi:hypothetical protein